MHPLLKQQYEEAFGTQALDDPKVQQLMSAVSETYERLIPGHEEYIGPSRLSPSVALDDVTREHAKLVAFVNGLSVGVLMIDDTFTVQLFNSALVKMLGLKQEVHPCTLRMVEDALGGSIDLIGLCAGVLSGQYPQAVYSIDAVGHYWRFILTPVVVDHCADNVIGVVLLIEDVTRERDIEKSRAEFFSMASHELRTPLTAIRGNASMLLEFYGEKVVDQDMHQMLEDMLASSEHTIKILNDLLESSRLEQGRIRLIETTFDLATVVAQTVESYRERCTKRSLMCTLAPHEPEIIQVFGDESRVREILGYVLEQALQHTEQGGITVSIAPSETTVEVLVQDTGSGYPKDQVSVLFEKISKTADKNHSRGVMETGLGLYLARSLVELMDGTIRLVENQEGKGSTIGFSIPTGDREHRTCAIPEHRQAH